MFKRSFTIGILALWLLSGPLMDNALAQDAPAAASELYDLPDEVIVPAPQCGCEEGTVCDCDYALCDTVKPPTVYLARTLIST